MRATRIASLLGALVLIAACSKAEPKPPVAQKPQVFADPVQQMPDGHPALSSLAIVSRGPRRMSVTQLEHSLDAIGSLPDGTITLPENLALTLGRPDYKQVSQESLEPSPLFMKFMLDLGSIYCANLAVYEPTRPADQKFFTRFDTADQNISFLLTRFTGIDGADAAPYLLRLQTVYQRASQSTVSLAGGQAVCVALFTSPEFLLY